MRILYLTQYFNLPGEAGGSRHFQHAKRWAHLGHDVSILCGNVNYKTGETAPLDPGRTYRLDQHREGFRIYRIWAFSRFQGSFKKRLLYFASYAAHASLVGSGLKRPDVVFASSTPLTVGLPGEVLARRFRVPFVFECRDLWPEAAVAAGVMKPGPWVDRARSLSRHLYRAADHLVTVTARMKDGILAHGIPDGKVTLVPNGVDDWMEPKAFQERNPLREFRDKFVCLYVGAHGVWNYLGEIVDAAECLRDDPRFAFVFIGDGDHRPVLQEAVRSKRLGNVHFLGPKPKEEAFAAMVHAGAGLITSSRTPHYQQILPNKIFDYLAAELPTITSAAPGEMVDMMERSGGGWHCLPGEPQSLARLIERAAALTPEERRAMGTRGRAFVLENYWRPALADRLLGVFEQTIRERRRPSYAGAA